MPTEKPKIGEGFFENLKPVKINMKSFEGRDKPGFELEDYVERFRVLAKRVDNNIFKPNYHITLFDGPNPTNIITSTKKDSFKEAIKTHYRALKKLEKIFKN